MRRASIRIDAVAVIAFFIGSKLEESVPAGSVFALRGAIVGVFAIAVVAFFVHFDLLIAASGNLAFVRAGITIGEIAIVACFTIGDESVSARAVCAGFIDQAVAVFVDERSIANFERRTDEIRALFVCSAKTVARLLARRAQPITQRFLITWVTIAYGAR